LKLKNLTACRIKKYYLNIMAHDIRTPIGAVLGFSVGDGVYWIDPDGYRGDDPFEAYCDMSTDGGGWILYCCSLMVDLQ
jgi:Fibrinogen beta and gamma chains, C-terminal globular domain.